MVEQERGPSRGWGGRYVGARVNCESVPCLPAAAVAWILNDPRQAPHLLIWKDPRTDEVMEVVRIAVCDFPIPVAHAGSVDVRRTNGSRSFIRTVEHRMPRNGGRGRLVICPLCQTPRRALYAWKVNRARSHALFIAHWQCRECAGLRYASEGGGLHYRPRSALGRLVAAFDGFTQHPRPEPWYPYMFANPIDAQAILPVHAAAWPRRKEVTAK